MGNQTYEVAVIGAGAAGTFAAYQVRKRLGNAARITVYEKNPHAGGRVWDVGFAGATLEAGGAVLHSSGRHTFEIMKLVGAKEGTPGVSMDGDDETFGWWTDKGFPVFTHSSLASMAVGIVRHVGPSSALKVTNHAKDMAAKWEGIYAIQGSGKTFQTVNELLDAVQEREAAEVSLGGYLKRLGVNDRMAKDIVEPITHNMYNQGLEMNAFAGLVGLAGAGLAGGYLFAVEGGNWTVFQKTLEAIGADARFSTRVTGVEALPCGGRPHGFAYRVASDDGERKDYDAVVLAVPPAMAGFDIAKEGAAIPIAKNPYQVVHTRFVAGELDPSYFHAKPSKGLPSTIFTADSAGAPFKSVGVTGFSPQYNSRIYKIFSADHHVTDEELSRIFAVVHDETEYVWRGAYPVLTTDVVHVPFKIQPGLYFANAFETAAGSVEVEAVSAINAANIMVDEFLAAQA